MLKIMDYHANPQEVYQLLAGRAPYDAEALVSAEQIFSAIQAEGDEALEGYCQRFGWKNPAEAIVSQEEIAAAYQQVDADFLAAIRLAIENVRCFHARQIPQGGLVPEADGTILGSLYIPVERAGIYAPGGHLCTGGDRRLSVFSGDGGRTGDFSRGQGGCFSDPTRPGWTR